MSVSFPAVPRSVIEISHLPSQENVLVDGSGRARLGDFGFTSVASLTCTETSSPGFGGSQQWMAPELFNPNEGKYGLSTPASDTFALGMVTLEVRNAHHGISFVVLEHILLVPFPRYSPDNCRSLHMRPGEL